MLENDFQQSIGYFLLVTAHAYERALNEELAPRGMTYRQAQVLGYLSLDGELCQTDLAERLSLEPPTLVGILDRMERDGWISRHDCPDDRRKKIIRPRPQAEPAWEEILQCARRIRARASRGLSAERMKALMESLQLIFENVADEKSRDSAGKVARR